MQNKHKMNSKWMNEYEWKWIWMKINHNEYSIHTKLYQNEWKINEKWIKNEQFHLNEILKKICSKMNGKHRKNEWKINYLTNKQRNKIIEKWMRNK